MATKEEIVRTIETVQSDLENAVSAMPEEAWSSGVYEDGWNARQILCHIASTSGVAGFVLTLADAPGGGGAAGSGGFDVDSFNAQQVAARENRSPADLVAEIRGNFERNIDAIRGAPDELIAKHFRAPWEVEGEVGDVIIESLNGHLGMHVADLQSSH